MYDFLTVWVSISLPSLAVGFDVDLLLQSVYSVVVSVFCSSFTSKILLAVGFSLTGWDHSPYVLLTL